MFPPLGSHCLPQLLFFAVSSRPCPSKGKVHPVIMIVYSCGKVWRGACSGAVGGGIAQGSVC